MLPVRLPYIRPMLFVPYDMIESYVAKNTVPFMEDASNADASHLRNRIRHELLPCLAQYNPNIERSLSSLSVWAQEDERYLAECARTVYDQIGAYSIPGLAVWMPRQAMAALPTPIAKRIVRLALESISAFHLEEGTLVQAADAALNGKSAQLQKDVYVRAGRDLQFYRTKTPCCDVVPLCLGQNRLGDFVVCITTEESASCGALWSVKACSDVLGGMRARTRRQGDRIVYEYGSKMLGRALSDAHVPYCIRDHLPVFFQGEQIVWAPGLRLPERFAAKAGGKQIILSIYPAQYGGQANE